MTTTTQTASAPRAPIPMATHAIDAAPAVHEAPGRPAARSDNGHTASLTAILSDLLSNKAQGEGISAKLLKAMFDNEVSFSTEWVKGFYTAEKGTDRTDILNHVIRDHLDNATQLFSTAFVKAKDAIGDIADNARRQKALKDAEDAQLTAQRRIKTLQNIIRAAIQALYWLRTSDATKLEVKSGKLMFTYKDEAGDLIKSHPTSFNDLVTTGSTKARQEGISSSRAPRTPVAVAPSGNTPKIEARLSDALRYCIQMLKDVDMESLTDNENALFRALETLCITKNYGDEHGHVNGKDVAEYYHGILDYRNEMPADKGLDAKAA